MKFHNKKVTAFTISELLVVLVISSILIGLSLTVLNLVQKQVSVIRSNYEKNTEIQQLERTLVYDFQRYKLLYNIQNNRLSAFSVNDTVTYHFNENFTVRNADTLYVSIVKLTKYLDGNPAKEGAIDAIELQLSKEFVAKKLFISKTKDASFYINNDGF